MADVDVWEQLAKFETDFRERTAGNPTKLTLELSVAEWLLERFRAQRGAPEPDLTLLTLFGISIAIGHEFLPGQVRIHHGEQFEDHYVIVPPTFPDIELMASYERIERQQQLWRLDTHAYAATCRPGRAPAPWESLGVVHGMTIAPPSA